MEYRNQCPKDRIDDALLIRLLQEEDAMPDYGCRSAPKSKGSSCGRNRANSVRPRRENGNQPENASCGRGGPLMGYPLAMVYIPDQEWESLYDEEEALSHGTMFQLLDFPFYPGKCRCGGQR